MRLPSLEQAALRARATVVRFPLSLASGFLATGVTLRLIEHTSSDSLPRLLVTAILGLPLFTASATSAERRGASAMARGLVDLTILLGLALLYRAALGWTDYLAALRFAQLLVAAHLLAALAPYLTTSRLDGFWQFNRFLLLRYVIGAFYAAVLWVGLAVALAALDRLFGVHVRGESYAKLWALMAFGFHPWFFLSGVPRDYDALETLEDYPLGLKVFTQFVLMPLVAIYLLILTAYLGKVILTRTWPNGWIGYLVSGVSATGVLALLLVHPLRERADSRWVNAYGRWWFVAILPSLGMLLVAIGKRTGQYGITEPRYFLLVLTLWLGGLALYYGVTASRNIKLIPMTLCAVALLTAVGPWGAYRVSERSQLSRLGRLLAANGMGRPGAITGPRAPVSLADRIQVSAILRYLGSRHGPRAVASVIAVPVDSVLAWSKANTRDAGDVIAQRAMERIGLGYVGRWDAGSDGTSFWVNSGPEGTIEVAGFEAVRTFSIPNGGWIGTATDSLELIKGSDAGSLVVRHAGAVIFTLDIATAVGSALQMDTLQARRTQQLKRPLLIDGAGSGYRVRLALQAVHGQLKGNQIVIQSANGLLMAGGFTGGPER
jgi:Domain of unknown function (DUF4153)